MIVVYNIPKEKKCPACGHQNFRDEAAWHEHPAYRSYKELLYKKRSWGRAPIMRVQFREILTFRCRLCGYPMEKIISEKTWYYPDRQAKYDPRAHCYGGDPNEW